jgi:hypothetical protein
MHISHSTCLLFALPFLTALASPTTPEPLLFMMWTAPDCSDISIYTGEAASVITPTLVRSFSVNRTLAANEQLDLSRARNVTEPLPQGTLECEDFVRTWTVGSMAPPSRLLGVTYEERKNGCVAVPEGFTCIRLWVNEGLGGGGNGSSVGDGDGNGNRNGGSSNGTASVSISSSAVLKASSTQLTSQSSPSSAVAAAGSSTEVNSSGSLSPSMAVSNGNGTTAPVPSSSAVPKASNTTLGSQISTSSTVAAAASSAEAHLLKSLLVSMLVSAVNGTTRSSSAALNSSSTTLASQSSISWFEVTLQIGASSQASTPVSSMAAASSSTVTTSPNGTQPSSSGA